MLLFILFPTSCKSWLKIVQRWINIRGKVESFSYFQRTLRTQAERLVSLLLLKITKNMRVDRLLYLTISWLTMGTDMTTERVYSRVQRLERTCLLSMSCFINMQDYHWDWTRLRLPRYTEVVTLLNLPPFRSVEQFY